MSRRCFIKTGALGVATTTLGSTLISTQDTFGMLAFQPDGMFCYQCEQTAKGTGCTVVGVCGKTKEVAALHDLLIYSLKGLADYAVVAREEGIETRDADQFIPGALFATLTNVDFDPERFQKLIQRSAALRDGLKEQVSAEGGSPQYKDGPAALRPASTIAGLVEQGSDFGLKSDPSMDADLLSLHHTMLFGIKGLAAYTDHARDLGQEDSKVDHFIQEGLVALLNKELGINEMLALVLKCGEMNLRAMELLDAGNTSKYGHPTPTSVPLGTKKGKAIMVSGHDLMALEQILILSEGKGINVYSHGEMLPTHGYPNLKNKYPHFYGHFGTAWQNQKKEFKTFPGAILVTTNCILQPQSEYSDNIFTSGLVGWPNIPHITNSDYSPVIQKALDLPGYASDVPGKEVNVGFARNTIMSVADKVIAGVKDGSIKHIFLVAGCDGAKSGRNYYTEFVEKVPKDCLVLTLACGKFRFFDKDLGDINGIPRLLDVGQCNDAYSAIQIAVALANAFDCGVNDLPLSMVLSWFEQKAVAILLTLFSLNIQNMKLGPSLPAFITPNVLDVLVKNYNIAPISTPDKDLKEILG